MPNLNRQVTNIIFTTADEPKAGSKTFPLALNAMFDTAEQAEFFRAAKEGW